jgi:hypothetical protein
MRVKLPNEACRGIDGPGGRVYRPARGKTYVEVPDNAFGKAAAQALGRAPDASFANAAAASVLCDGCGYDNWPWVKVCPRCKRELK